MQHFWGGTVSLGGLLRLLKTMNIACHYRFSSDGSGHDPSLEPSTRGLDRLHPHTLRSGLHLPAGRDRFLLTRAVKML